MTNPGVRKSDGRRLLTLVVALCLVGICIRGWNAVSLEEGRANLIPPPDMRLDVNTASEAELGLLPGIGPTLAANIVADRLAYGPFRDIDDLQRVKRIGPVTVDRIRPFIVIEREVQPPRADGSR